MLAEQILEGMDIFLFWPVVLSLIHLHSFSVVLPAFKVSAAETLDSFHYKLYYISDDQSTKYSAKPQQLLPDVRTQLPPQFSSNVYCVLCLVGGCRQTGNSSYIFIYLLSSCIITSAERHAALKLNAF